MNRTSPRGLAGVVISTALLASACATGRPANRFIRGGGSETVELMETPVRLPAVSPAAVEAAVASATVARNAAATSLPTVEGTDQALALALRILQERPGALAHVRVGQAYARLGVLDFAIDHFDQALRLDSRIAAAYDGRARIWRDWHLPGLALGDAYRAVQFAPASPVTRNTLGTVLMALGHCAAAERTFVEALSLDPKAAYVAANLQWIEANRDSARCRESGAEPSRPASLNEAPGTPDGRGAR